VDCAALPDERSERAVILSARHIERQHLEPVQGRLQAPAASWVDGRLAPAQRPTELRADVEANLRSLGLDRLEIVNLRRIDSPPGLVAKGNQVVDLEDQLAELLALRDAGTIAAIGLSNVSVEQLSRAAGAGIACVQNSCNLLERDSEPVLHACTARGIAFVPFFPLGSGFPGRRRVTDDPRVRAVAARLDATPAQIGLAWLLAQHEQVLVIPGTRSADHLTENVAAGSIVLDQQTLDELEYDRTIPSTHAGQQPARLVLSEGSPYGNPRLSSRTTRRLNRSSDPTRTDTVRILAEFNEGKSQAPGSALDDRENGCCEWGRVDVAAYSELRVVPDADGDEGLGDRGGVTCAASGDEVRNGRAHRSKLCVDDRGQFRGDRRLGVDLRDQLGVGLITRENPYVFEKSGDRLGGECVR
jgi:aryl-alcohol dehydrogenase-like predicted oxidoreductase